MITSVEMIIILIIGVLMAGWGVDHRDGTGLVLGAVDGHAASDGRPV